MATASPLFDSYRSRHGARPPNLDRQRYPDEVRLITATEGLVDLTTAPINTFHQGVPPGMQVTDSINKYLWVVGPNEVPIAIEGPRPTEQLARGYLSHTNLTGGGNAHCGGELWFIDDSTVIINGASSRYAPRGASELNEVALDFKASGYRTATMGWNDETGASNRYLRGDPQWV